MHIRDSPNGWGRYGADCTVVAAHGGVAPNGYAILRRYSAQGAPPCAPVRFSEPHP